MSINQDFMMDKDNLRNGQVQGGGVLAPEASAGHAEPEVERKWQWNRMVYAILLLQVCHSSLRLCFRQLLPG